MTRISMNHRILTWDDREIEFSGDPAINISDTVFGFLDEESEGSSVGSISDYGENEIIDADDNNDEKDNSENGGDKSFWESQNQQLQVNFFLFPISGFSLLSILSMAIQSRKFVIDLDLHC